MANRRPQGGGRRMDYGHNDRGKNFGRSGVSPWQGGGPSGSLPNLLPLSGVPTEATLALASNIINLLQPRQNQVPSLLDMPMRRDFGPDMGRYDRGYGGPNRMGNQGNFRRTGNYNSRTGERINMNRKPFRPNDGRHHHKNSPKKEADSKAKPVKESEEKDKDSKDEDSKEGPKTRYDDIDAQLLRCHICHKSMWDGRSFENHLSGRAHAIMMQKTAESYALTADTMRQEYKIREMKRTRKSGQQPARDFYCAMCDMYAGDGAVHRTTVGHRKLKKYLHPTCTCCHKEMPTRIELDEHRLSAEHLRNIHDKNELVTKPKPEVMVISTLTMEQSYLREDRERRKPQDDKEKTADKEANEDGEAEVKVEPVEGDEAKPEKESLDNDNTVLDYKEGDDLTNITPDMLPAYRGLDNDNTVLDYKEGDDLTNITPDMLPAYSTERGVGASFLQPFHCVQCKLCRKLLDGDETAEVHLRTWRHHQLFTRLLTQQQEAKQQAAEVEAEKAEQESNKRVAKAEESGNWKRRRTSETGHEANGHGDDDMKVGRVHAEAEESGNWKRRRTSETGHEANGHGDDDMKDDVDGVDEGGAELPPDDALEDWEQSVDEILQDERGQY
ncbi:zinc finger protein on ecdysone puffs-like [Cydia amplana]|uniref:zinc finger protein on ecdysone puffs-like n=1 Tax=Cydia amplana TaxID=1869771 RepID=UPI002FE6A031